MIISSEATELIAADSHRQGHEEVLYVKEKARLVGTLLGDRSYGSTIVGCKVFRKGQRTGTGRRAWLKMLSQSHLSKVDR